jgi:hypothetical protein
MFVCLLLGGLSMCLAVGLLDVFVLRADAISTQASVSAGLDLALGVPLVAIGALLVTDRLHGRRRAPAPSSACRSTAQPRSSRSWPAPTSGACCATSRAGPPASTPIGSKTHWPQPCSRPSDHHGTPPGSMHQAPAASPSEPGRASLRADARAAGDRPERVRPGPARTRPLTRCAAKDTYWRRKAAQQRKRRTSRSVPLGHG